MSRDLAHLAFSFLFLFLFLLSVLESFPTLRALFALDDMRKREMSYPYHHIT
jgi:hypothetical protein